MSLRTNSTCTTCSKKCLTHKTIVNCRYCLCNYHPKCVNLAPNDVNQLKDSNILAYWTCPSCTIKMFPMVNHTGPESHQINTSTQRSTGIPV